MLKFGRPNNPFFDLCLIGFSILSGLLMRGGNLSHSIILLIALIIMQTYRLMKKSEIDKSKSLSILELVGGMSVIIGIGFLEYSSNIKSISIISGYLVFLFSIIIRSGINFQNKRERKESILILLPILIIVSINIFLLRNGYATGSRYHDFSLIIRRLINLQFVIEIILSPFGEFMGFPFSGGKIFFTPYYYDISKVIGAFITCGLIIRIRNWKKVKCD